MEKHSARQLEILKKMGIDVWSLRHQEVVVEEVKPATTVESIAQPLNELEELNKQLSDLDQQAESLQNKHAQLEANTEKFQNQNENLIAENQHEQPVKAPIQRFDSLLSVKTSVKKCTQCSLHQTRTQTVFGVGNEQADWMFVGEAPGQTEDEQGLPFVGRAGQLLDSMIAALGMQREQVFIANVLKCRPPNNRDPLPEEIDLCENYLHHQLQLIRPKVIISLGRISAQALLRSSDALGKLRQAVHSYGELSTPLIATYHPAYLLRSPDQKAKAWDDLWKAKQIVEGSTKA